MIVRKNRVVSKEEFQELYQKGKRLKSLHFIVYWKPIERFTYRCGIVISNKVIQKAAVRNRAKRRLRAVLKQNEVALHGKAAIFIVKSSMVKLPYQEIVKEVKEITSKLC